MFLTIKENQQKVEILARDKDGNFFPVTIKIFNKETDEILMEFEVPIDEGDDKE